MHFLETAKIDFAPLKFIRTAQHISLLWVQILELNSWWTFVLHISVAFSASWFNIIHYVQPRLQDHRSLRWYDVCETTFSTADMSGAWSGSLVPKYYRISNMRARARCALVLKSGDGGASVWEKEFVLRKPFTSGVKFRLITSIETHHSCQRNVIDFSVYFQLMNFKSVCFSKNPWNCE